MNNLSYFNIGLSLIYLLFYLRSGTFNSTAGITAIVVFNWLAIRSFVTDRYGWTVWQYLFGLWSVYYSLYLGNGTYNLIATSIEVGFILQETLLNILLSLFLICGVLLHFIQYFKKSGQLGNRQ